MVAIAALCGASGSLAAEPCTFFVRAGFVPPAGRADGRTPTTAFATISAGARAVRNPDDVVCVGPGVYVEGNIGLGADGALGPVEGDTAHPIELRADSSGESTGDPAGAVRIVPPTGTPGAELITTAFLLMGRHDVIIDGFEISGFSDAGIQVRAAVNGTNSSNVTIRNNVITDCRTGIDVLAEDMVVIEGNQTIGSTSSGISVERCLVPTEEGRCRTEQLLPVVPVISNNRSGGNAAHGIFMQTADNAIVQNNVVYANGATGISVRESNDTLVANNLVYANGQQGIAVGKKDLASPGTVVLNNTIYANAQWGVEIGSGNAGSPRGAVVNNIILQNGGGSMGVGVLNENSGLMPVRPASTCGYVAGFNFVRDAYGPDTPFNNYDRDDDPSFVDPAGNDGMLGGERVEGRFVDHSADDDFHLQQVGGESRSPAVDGGSAPVAEIGLTGSTASDGRPDTGAVDAGYHYGATAEQVLAFAAPFMPLYVRRLGTDFGDGLTPPSALRKIADAAQRARAGVTVVVGPGRYPECQIYSPANGGKAAFVADPTGERTGDRAQAVFIDAGQCIFDPDTSLYKPGETGIDISSECDVVVEGFHVSGALEDGIRVDSHSDRAVVRNNVVFENGKRGIRIVNSDDVRIANNLVYDNEAGIALGGSCQVTGDCPTAGSRRAVIEFNTTYKNTFNGIQVGDGIGVSSGATVRYNVTGENGKVGIEVGDDSTRVANLVDYVSRYNLVGDRYGAGVPRGLGDLLLDLSVEPLYLDANPVAIDTSADWLNDQHFRLVQSAVEESRAVDYADITAAKAGLADRSTRADGMADAGAADLGYHYPRRERLVGDCNGDGRVLVNEVVLGVNIALDQVPMSSCTAVDMNGDGQCTVNELIVAVGSALQG